MPDPAMPGVPFQPLSQTNTAGDQAWPKSTQRTDSLVQPERPDRSQDVQAWRSPYVPASARGHGMWGEDHWATTAATSYPGNDVSPMLPTPMEAFGIIRGTGQQLSQYGSRAVGQYGGRSAQLAMSIAPILDMYSKGAFSKNFMAARMQGLRAQQEEMILNEEAKLQQQRNELQAYSKIIGAYNAGGISSERAHNDIEQIAIQTGNDYLIGILRNKGIGAAEKYLDWYDAKWVDGAAANASAKRSSKTGGMDPFSDDQSGAGPGTSYGGAPDRPDPLAQHPDIEPATKREAPSGIPATPQAGATNTMDDQLKKDLHLNDAGVQAVHDGLFGASNVPKGYRSSGPMDAGVRKMEAGIEAAANNNNLSPEDRLKAIEGIDSHTGSDVRGLLDLSTDPKSLPLKSRDRIIDLARAIGHYKPDNFEIAKKFRNDTTIQKNLTRIGTLSPAALQYFQAINDLKENETIPARNVERWWATNASGNPKYDAVLQAAFQFYSDVLGLQSGTGRTPISTLNNVLFTHNIASKSPAQLRVAATQEVNNAKGVIDHYDQRWKAETGMTTSFPEYPSYNAAVLDAMGRGNPYTGVMPRGDDVPEQVRNLSKDGTQFGATIRPEQRWTPIEKADVSKAQGALRYYDTHPDEYNALTPEKKQYLDMLKRAIGIYH